MTDEPRSICSPCRGTGMLTSNKGGEPHAVPCPWCGGTGRFVPGRDAQTGGVAQHRPRRTLRARPGDVRR